MINLIFTADDYGAHDILDNAVLDGVRNGKINSVAIFPNASDLKRRIERLKAAVPANVDMQYGCHLTFTTGKPLYSPTPKNFMKGEYFRPIGKLQRAPKKDCKLELDYVSKEIRRQITAIEECGVEVSHLSCHYNTLLFFDDYFDEYLKVAADFVPLPGSLSPVDEPDPPQPSKKRSIAIRSPKMIPAKDYDTFTDLAVPGLNKLFIGRGNKTRRRFVDWRRDFDKEYPKLLKKYKIKTPTFTFTDHYGPALGKKLSEYRMDKEVKEKHEVLTKFIQKYDSTEETKEKYEVMLHLIEDNYAKRDIFRKKLKWNKKRRYIDGYPGVGAGSVDARMCETRSLNSFIFPESVKLVKW